MNLLMPISSLLISNKKVLSYNWLATNNNFWCRQELKMFQMHNLKKRDFPLAIWHMFFLTKGEHVYKNLFKRLVLKSKCQNPRNLGKNNWFFHTINTKTTYNSRQNKKQIKYAFTSTAREIVRGTTKHYVKIKMIWDFIN